MGTGRISCDSRSPLTGKRHFDTSADVPASGHCCDPRLPSGATARGWREWDTPSRRDPPSLRAPRAAGVVGAGCYPVTILARCAQRAQRWFQVAMDFWWHVAISATTGGCQLDPPGTVDAVPVAILGRRERQQTNVTKNSRPIPNWLRPSASAGGRLRTTF